ncbi:hypothetical protein BIW11_09864, partial [Tropilaelaps mercedesae]
MFGLRGTEVLQIIVLLVLCHVGRNGPSLRSPDTCDRHSSAIVRHVVQSKLQPVLDRYAPTPIAVVRDDHPVVLFARPPQVDDIGRKLTIASNGAEWPSGEMDVATIGHMVGPIQSNTM